MATVPFTAGTVEAEMPLGEEAEVPMTDRSAVAASSLRILMAAGGTGGHIFPALAVAEELRARHEGGEEGTPLIEFLGTGRGLEARVVPAAGFRLRTVRAAGLKGIGGLKRLVNLAVLPLSALETARVLREFRPHVVVGIGGYLAGPAMLEAALRDIPTLLIEPNAVPGFTNRVLAPLVRLAAVGFEESARFYGGKARVTGHAVRRAFFSVPVNDHRPPHTVLILGGSQGAKAVNDCVVQCAALFGPDEVRFIHQTGERDYNAVQEAYRRQGVEAEVHAFIDDVPQAMARADLLVSRAGAMSVAEVAAAGRAAVFIPFPHAADQHQLENARALERAGAARVMEQNTLTPERLAETIRELLARPERLGRMERAARSLARPGATAHIANLVLALARRGAPAG